MKAGPLLAALAVLCAGPSVASQVTTWVLPRFHGQLS